MTVWVFGDSFAYLHNRGKTWPILTAEKLGQNLCCLAEGGTSLEYTYEQFNSVRNDIKLYDTVIIALTEPNRRWVNRSNITENIWMTLRYNKDPELVKAIENYLRYLENPTVYETYLANFLYNLKHITLKLNLNTLILPCFNTTEQVLTNLNIDIPTATGNLYAISHNEFEPNFDHTYFTTVGDLRPNHLSRSNHHILSDKIYRAIHNKEKCRLDRDFQKEFINDTTVQDHKFNTMELFDSENPYLTSEP